MWALHGFEIFGEELTSALLEQGRQAREHLAVQSCRAVRVYRGADSRVRHGVLRKRHQYAQPDLEGIAAQTLQQCFIRISAMLGGIVSKLQKQRSVAVHRPQTARAIDSFPDVCRGRLNTATIEITLGDFIESPVVGPECGHDLVPASLLPPRLRAAPQPYEDH